MCGIFGHIGDIAPDQAKKCLDTLSHRGPDGYGLKSLPGATLGQRRLAILDLSDKGAQPMRYKDRYTISFNGEIYNFIEVRKELESLGYSFESDSDTEVILAAYDKWGESGMEKLNGMWALGIWDEKEQKLFISRDRFGKKPLFYTKTASGLAFASEMKALAPIALSLTPNKKLLKDIEHIFYYESTSECLIEEIKRFPAGHSGFIDAQGNLTLKRYWNTLDHVKPVTESYEEQVKKLRELFLDTCAIRMRSDVTMGTALSGGLDSSAVFSAVASISKTKKVERASNDWQHAFNASFPGTPLDERAFAEKVAKDAGAQLKAIEIDPKAHVEKMLDEMYVFEDIYITPQIPFLDTYGAMRKGGVKVTLDGHAADELFGGYSFDYLHILHDELFNPKAYKDVLDAYYGSQIQDGQFKQKGRKAFAAKLFAKNLAKRILGRKNHSREENHPAWKQMDYFTQKLYISSHETVLPTLLRNYDRYSMANGIEIRMPFLDHRIVTYALSLPWQSKIRNGFTKAIVRDMASAFLSHDIAYRKTKIGFNSPMIDWVRGPLKDFFTGIVNSKEYKESGLGDSAKARQALEAILNDPKATFAQGEALWKEVVAYLWFEGFYKKALASRS